MCFQGPPSSTSAVGLVVAEGLASSGNASGTSASAHSIGRRQRPLLPRRTLSPAVAPRRSAGAEHHALAQNSSSPSPATIPWPGPDFELKQFLPGSAYLWACGERGEGDGTSPVSRPEFLAGWVVLITQVLCYVELWFVSGSHTPLDSRFSSGSQASSSQSTTDYSIIAIAVAMYLLLSIAVADLWGGFALVLEGRGTGKFALFTYRRFFGVCLLASFGALIAASTLVLFHSSYENVDWVLGAAAVLFIADVDEKTMALLNNFGNEWRLFWVLDLIGFSFGLAILVVKLTGNDDTVSNGRRCESVWETDGCSIFGWVFILNLYPVAVTLFSLLVAKAVSRLEFSRVRECRSHCRGWFRYSLILVTWVLYIIWATLEYPSLNYYYAATFLGGIVVLAGGVALLRGRGQHVRNLKLAYARGSQRLRPVDKRCRLGLFWTGFALIFVRAAIEGVDAVIREGQDPSCEGETRFFDEVVEPAREYIDVLLSVWYTALDAWTVFGMELAGVASPSAPRVDPNRAVPPPVFPLLLGWCSHEALVALAFWRYQLPWELATMHCYVYPAVQFAESLSWMMWRLTVGTLLWGWTLGIRDITYWHAATMLSSCFMWCMYIIINATSNQVVT